MTHNLKKFLVTAILLFVSASILAGCNRLNQNPPKYIKELAVYKEGYNNLVIYFILADESGAMTTADGTVRLKIVDNVEGNLRDGVSVSDFPDPLLSISLDVKKKDFEKQQVGSGQYKHNAVLFSFGRIPYSAFPRRTYSRRGWAVLEFQPKEGTTLRAYESIYFF